MIRKVMIEVDENDLDDFIERGIVRADAARNTTLIYESDDCINRQSVHDYISKNEYGAWVELPESTMHEDIDKLSSVIPENKWISVKERLPENTQPVLMTIRRMGKLYNHEPFITVGCISWNQTTWWCAHDGDCVRHEIDVLAWMPILEYKDGD